MNRMRTIRASEIGVYLFCKRAWWFQINGAPSENQKELAGGSAFHQRHGRQVMSAALLRAGGWVLLAAAFIVFAVALVLLLVAR